MKTLIVVLGPTGVGKTALCLNLAQRYGAHIISADSRQMFAELPIGTAAATHKEQLLVPHHFVGNLKLDQYYSAACFETDALNLLDSLFQSNDVAVMTGGSMMYIDAVCHGIDDIPTVDDNTRLHVKQMLDEQGLDALVQKLKQLDPEHYDFVDKQNPRRVCHALEICLMTGNTYTSYRKKVRKQRPFNILKIGLNRERDVMYERINQRVLQMIDKGLEEEARRVYPLRGLNSLNTVGYKELFAYFDGNIPREEAIRQIQSNTRRYMRKQLTWFKKNTEITWFDPNDTEKITNFIDSFVGITD
ncbi:tRNA (adenosine(37)-N6)-dimethylallyltransferase MiaA [Hoylesella shahii]|uniref:tRNA dimethylallyltransferase n=1 Tax=Hoylesella shahii DSM 15611 = JCM 12083 TaxID=1122991 RepID=A0A318HPY2_9BACT|nr:tRNA (adenosine(37)-N6)-dimethylallyltransferase MiaA [Hoylesella shahii]PXX19437.1 tRNA dimethylallyltransferase [Hoylesella shahii DSM 15611 = JCM 12083]